MDAEKPWNAELNFGEASWIKTPLWKIRSKEVEDWELAGGLVELQNTVDVVVYWRKKGGRLVPSIPDSQSLEMLARCDRGLENGSFVKVEMIRIRFDDFCNLVFGP